MRAQASGGKSLDVIERNESLAVPLGYVFDCVVARRCFEFCSSLATKSILWLQT